MTKREYFHKRIDPEKEKKRLAFFNEGKKFGDEYNFQKLLKENKMIWEQFPSGFGRITHTPTRLHVMMEVTPKTRTQHKKYMLDKLKDKVSNHLYHLEIDNTPVNTLI